MIQPWINILAGLWAFFSSFSMSLIHPANFIIIGIVVAIFGFSMSRMWQGTLTGVVGLWLIISGLIPALQVQTNLLVMGIAIVVFTIWQIAESRAPRRPAHARR